MAGHTIIILHWTKNATRNSSARDPGVKKTQESLAHAHMQSVLGYHLGLYSKDTEVLHAPVIYKKRAKMLRRKKESRQVG